MNSLGKAKNILTSIVDCLFPRCCTICNRRTDVDGYDNLCSSCIAKIPWIGSARCSICSCPMGDNSGGDGGKLVCSACKATVPHFQCAMACWLHSGVGRDIVLTLKYRNADFLKNDIAMLLKNNCQEVCQFAENSLLVPVPMHYFKRVRRGYNQAEVIADAVSKIASGSKVVNMLSGKNKKSQTRLEAKDRLLNIKNMFECSYVSCTIPKNSKIVLVDDVFTTGATAGECCRVLRDAGFYDLRVLTLSHG